MIRHFDIKTVIAVSAEAADATQATHAHVELLSENGPLDLRVSKSVARELVGELQQFLRVSSSL